MRIAERRDCSKYAVRKVRERPYIVSVGVVEQWNDGKEAELAAAVTCPASRSGHARLILELIE